MKESKFHQLLLKQMNDLKLSDEDISSILPLLETVSNSYKTYEKEIDSFRVINNSETQKLRVSYQELEKSTEILQKRIDSQVHEMERFASVINDCIFRTNLNGEFLYVNDVWEKYTGVKAKDAIGKHYSLFIESLDLETSTNLLNLGFNKQEIAQLELKTKGKGLDSIWFKLTVQLTRDDLGNASGITGRIIDITDLKHAQLKYQESQFRYRNILNQAPTGIIGVENEKIIGINSFFENMINYTEEELMGQSIYKFLATPDHKGVQEFFSSSDLDSSNYKPEAFKLRFITKEGDVRFGHGFTSKEFIEDKKLIRYLFSISDETENYKTKKKLKQQDATLSAVLESTPDNILVFNLNKELIIFDQTSKEAFKRNFNFDLELNDTVFDKLQYKHAHRYDDMLGKALQGEHLKLEFQSEPGINDHIRYSNIYSNPVRNSENEIVGAIIVAHEITEVKRKQIELQANEALLRTIMDTSPDGIYAIDLDYNVVAMNSRAKKDFKFGLNIDLQIGDSISTKVPKELFKRWDQSIYKKIFQGNIFEREAAHKFGEQEVIHLNHYAPIKNEKGDLFGAIEYSRNITNQKKNEKLLILQEKQLRNILENSKEAIIYVDVKSQKIIDCNNGALEMYKVNSRNELQELTFEDRTPEYQLNGMKSTDFFKIQRDKLFKTGKAEYQFLGRDVNGKEFIGSDVSVLENHESGPRMLFFTVDITESYYAQQEIEERKTIYESLINNSFDGIDISQYMKNDENIEGSLIVRNQKMKELMQGMEDPFLTVENVSELTDEIQANNKTPIENINNIIKQLESKNHASFEWIFKKGLDKIYIEGLDQLIHVNDKNILIRIYKDVTARKNQEIIIGKQILDLNEKNNQLKKYIESNLQLENFAYIASHDLKAPLRTVSSFSDLLFEKIKDKLDPKELNFLQIIRESSKNMLDLIEDLLRYSRVNTNKIKVENIDPTKAIHDIINEIQEIVQTKNAKITIEELPQQIEFDPTKFRQLFQNLITNSLKYSKENVQSKIDISCEDKTESWLFKIKDNGIGIEKEYIDKIFLLFQKLHSTDKYEGNGIGLSICKTIMDQHGGKISVHSEFKLGSEFFLEVPKKTKGLI